MSSLEQQEVPNIGTNNNNKYSHFQNTLKYLERKKTYIIQEIQELQNDINKNSQNQQNLNEQNVVIDVEIQILKQIQIENHEKLAALMHDDQRIYITIRNLHEDLKLQEQQLQFSDDQIQNTKIEQSNIDLQIRIIYKDTQLLNQHKYELEQVLSNKERELEKLIYEEQRLGVWDDLIEEEKSQQKEATLILQKQIASINEEINGNKSYVEQLGENVLALQMTSQQLLYQNHQTQKQIQSIQRNIDKQQSNRIKIEQNQLKIRDDIRQIENWIQQKVQKYIYLLERQSLLKSEIKVQLRDLQANQSELYRVEYDIKLNYQQQDQVQLRQFQVDEEKELIKQQVQQLESDIIKIKQDYVIYINKKYQIDQNMQNQIEVMNQVDQQISEQVQERQTKNQEYEKCKNQIQTRQSQILQDYDKLNNINEQLNQEKKNFQDQQDKYNYLLQNFEQLNEKLRNLQSFQSLIEQELLGFQEFKSDPSLELKREGEKN